jgi:hypothetical protein
MIRAPDETNCERGSQEPTVPRRASPFEQRFGAAPLAELCGNIDPHPGDFGFQFGDIAFEFRDPQQGQVLWLRRFAPRFEIRLVHAFRSPFVFPRRDDATI